MATLLLLTNDMHASAEILPALELLPHQVKVAQAEATALLDAPSADVILLDARRDLVGARSLCRLMETTGKEAPLLVIAHEGGLAALSADWGFDDLVLTTAGPAEVDVRLRSGSPLDSAEPMVDHHPKQLEVDRLGQVVVRPQTPARQLVLAILERGEKDKGHPRERRGTAGDRRTSLLSIPPGMQSPVEAITAEGLGRRLLSCLRSVAGTR